MSNTPQGGTIEDNAADDALMVNQGSYKDLALSGLRPYHHEFNQLDERVWRKSFYVAGFGENFDRILWRKDDENKSFDRCRRCGGTLGLDGRVLLSGLALVQ